MALHVTKVLKRPTDSGKVTVTGKLVSKYQSGFRPIHSILATVIYMTDNCYYNIEDGLTNATLFLLIMRSSCQNWSCMGFKVQVLIFFETTSLLVVRLQLPTM